MQTLSSQSKALDDIHLCVIELSKYKKLKESNQIETDDWADLLNAKTNEAFEDIEKRGGIMAEAVQKLNFFTQDEIDQYWDEMYEKYEMDMRSNAHYWKNEGIAIGRNEGISIGEKRGKIEGLLIADISYSKITELTGATEEEILEVKKNM